MLPVGGGTRRGLRTLLEGEEGATGPLMGRQGCPAPGSLPLIWAAARVVPCPSPIPTPSFLSGRMFHSFLEGSEVNEAKARNTTRG